MDLLDSILRGSGPPKTPVAKKPPTTNAISPKSPVPIIKNKTPVLLKPSNKTDNIQSSRHAQSRQVQSNRKTKSRSKADSLKCKSALFRMPVWNKPGDEPLASDVYHAPDPVSQEPNTIQSLNQSVRPWVFRATDLIKRDKVISSTSSKAIPLSNTKPTSKHATPKAKDLIKSMPSTAGNKAAIQRAENRRKLFSSIRRHAVEESFRIEKCMNDVKLTKEEVLRETSANPLRETSLSYNLSSTNDQHRDLPNVNNAAKDFKKEYSIHIPNLPYTKENGMHTSKCHAVTETQSKSNTLLKRSTINPSHSNIRDRNNGNHSKRTSRDSRNEPQNGVHSRGSQSKSYCKEKAAKFAKLSRAVIHSRPNERLNHVVPEKPADVYKRHISTLPTPRPTENQKVGVAPYHMKKPVDIQPYHESDSWSESDLDFIDDEEDKHISDWRSEMRKITKYDPRVYRGESLEECQESGFAEQTMEESYSSRIAREEDDRELALLMQGKVKRKRF